jgi:hypothetical protein
MTHPYPLHSIETKRRRAIANGPISGVAGVTMFLSILFSYLVDEKQF